MNPAVKSELDNLQQVISESAGQPIQAIRQYTVYDDGGIDGVYRLGEDLFNFTIQDGQFSSESIEENTDSLEQLELPIHTDGIPDKYRHISFAVPLNVQKAAKKGLELRKKHGRGGLTTQEAGEQGIGSGVARARDLTMGRVTPDTARRILSYFQRHEVDKKGKDWDNKKRPSNGRIAWELWGGQSGYEWAKRIVNQMDIADRRGE